MRAAAEGTYPGWNEIRALRYGGAQTGAEGGALKRPTRCVDASLGPGVGRYWSLDAPGQGCYVVTSGRTTPKSRFSSLFVLLAGLALSQKRKRPTSIRGIAQPGSAEVLGTSGRRFESCCPDQITQ
jgi:hypothetical protein